MLQIHRHAGKSFSLDRFFLLIVELRTCHTAVCRSGGIRLITVFMNGNKGVVDRIVNDPALALIVSEEETFRNIGVVFGFGDVPCRFGSVRCKCIRSTFGIGIRVNSFIASLGYEERVVEDPGRTVYVADKINEAKIHFVSFFIIAVSFRATGFNELNRNLVTRVGHSVLSSFERNNDQSVISVQDCSCLVIFKGISDSAVSIISDSEQVRTALCPGFVHSILARGSRNGSVKTCRHRSDDLSVRIVQSDNESRIRQRSVILFPLSGGPVKLILPLSDTDAGNIDNAGAWAYRLSIQDVIVVDGIYIVAHHSGLILISGYRYIIRRCCQFIYFLPESILEIRVDHTAVRACVCLDQQIYVMIVNTLVNVRHELAYLAFSVPSILSTAGIRTEELPAAGFPVSGIKRDAAGISWHYESVQFKYGVVVFCIFLSVSIHIMINFSIEDRSFAI